MTESEYIPETAPAHGCGGCAKVVRHPSDGYVCALHTPRGLDPGITATVSLLIAAGFNTTDSGDGVSKPDVGRVFDFPHVVAVVAPDDLLKEARRLRRILEFVGIIPRPQDGTHPAIEAAYDVGADVATILLSGVNDAMLRRARPVTWKRIAAEIWTGYFQGETEPAFRILRSWRGYYLEWRETREGIVLWIRYRHPGTDKRKGSDRRFTTLEDAQAAAGIAKVAGPAPGS